MKKWIWAVLVLLLAWNSFLTYRLLYPNNEENKPNNGINIEEESVTDYITDLTSVVEKTRSSVVRVNYRFGKDIVSQSGVIFSNSDNLVYIITSIFPTATNELSVVFDNGKATNATIVKADIETGICIISCEVDFSVNAFRLGDASLIEQGEYVVALASRNKYDSAPVSFGIVSESGLRKLSPSSSWFVDIFETDANIAQEFLGGALVNVGGELVGIIIDTPFDSNGHMGYALSVDEAKLIFNEALEGELNRGTLQVVTRDMRKLRAYEKSAWNISLTQDTGVIVLNNNSDNDLLIGDVIVSWNGETVNDYHDLRRLEYESSSKDKVTLTVLRGNRRIEIEAELK